MILGVSIFFFHIAAQTSGPFVKVEVWILVRFFRSARRFVFLWLSYQVLLI